MTPSRDTRSRLAAAALAACACAPPAALAGGRPDEADTRRIAAEGRLSFTIAHLGSEPDGGFWPETFGRLYIVDKDGRIVRELEGVHTSEQLAELLRGLP